MFCVCVCVCVFKQWLSGCCQGVESAEGADFCYEPSSRRVYNFLAETAWLSLQLQK